MRSRRTVIWVALVALLAFVLSGSAAGTTPGQRVVSVLGLAQVEGQPVVVDILVVVPSGADQQAAATAALQQLGARPFAPAALGSEGFTLTGLVWNTLPVIQYYNPQNEPAGLGGQSALENTYATWDGVAASSFDINFGGTTSRCPSLVQECPGPQYFDGKNDVGWLRLGANILGVTWYGTSTDEADIALSTAYPWSPGCTNVADSFDAQTVFGHENGHIVGLGHSSYSAAVMYAYYQGARCSLHYDDAEGATYLYPNPTQTATVSGTVSDSSSNRVAGAVVSLRNTPFSATTDANGHYSLTDVPWPVHYSLSVSKRGFKRYSERVYVDTGSETADVTLTQR